MTEQVRMPLYRKIALLAKEVLESMGVTEYEPKVLQQLMDFMYRYTSEILQDAEAISERAGGPRGEVALPDVMLAVQSRAQYSFVQPPSQQVLAGIAAQHNSRPLPELRPDRYGLRLPPEGDCLLAPNYQLQPRTPEGMPPPLQPPPQPQQPQHAATTAAAAARGHAIEMKLPTQLPQGQAGGVGRGDPGGMGEDSGGGGGWAEVPSGQAGGDTDMAFEDI